MQANNQLPLLTRYHLFQGISPDTLPRVIIVSAPSGYGKTVFVQQFIKHIGHPAVWHPANQWQQDIPSLAESCIRAWATLLPDITDNLQLSDNTKKDAKQSALEISAYISKHITQRCTYIIDDVHHLIDQGNAETWIKVLVDTLPKNICVFLVGHTIATASWANLVLKNEVVSFTEQHLRFTEQDVQQLTTLPPAEVSNLVKKFDGWAAGIYVAIQSTNSQVAGELYATSEEMFYRLVNNLTSKLSPDLQNFLFVTSVPRTWHPALCRFLGLSNVEHHLSSILHQNLFVRHLDNAYAYHDLFREFLQKRFAQQNPEYYQEIQRMVAGWYEDKDQIEEAISHYAQAGDMLTARRKAEEVAKEFYTYGKWQSLLEFNRLLKATDSTLLHFFSGVIYGEKNELAASFAELSYAQKLALEQNDMPNWMRIQLQLALNYYLLEKFDLALECAEQVLAHLADNENANPNYEHWAYRLRGLACCHIGLLDNGINDLKKSLAYYKSDTNSYGQILQDLGHVYLLDSNLGAAEAALQQLVTLQRDVGNLNNLAFALNNLGYYYHISRQYELAIDILQLGIETLQEDSRAAGYLRWTLGDVYRDLGRFEDADDQYRLGISIVSEGDQSLYNGLFISLARLRIWQGHYIDALACIKAIKWDSIQDIYLHTIGVMCQLLEILIHPESARIEGIEQAMAMAANCLTSNRLSKLVGLYWYVGFKLQNKALMDHAVAIIVDIKPAFLGTVAAELINLGVVAQIDIPKLKLSNLRLALDALHKLHQPKQIEFKLQYIHQIEIHAFGQEMIIADGIDIPTSAWTVAEARELFYYLYFNGGQRKEVIAAEFWSDIHSSKLRDRFHTTRKRALKALPDSIIYDDNVYRVNPRFNITCDVDLFVDYIKRARHLLPDKPRTASLYERAISLYKGDFLSNFYAEWVLDIRQRLEKQYHEALARYGDCLFAQEDFDNAVSAYKRALSTDPYSDGVVQSLMRCYHKLNQPQDIQLLFNQFAKRLWSDLATAPSHETKRLLKDLITTNIKSR